MENRQIVVCVSLHDESIDLLKSLKNFDWKESDTVHFVHCFKKELFTNDFTPYTYPSEEDYDEINQSIKEILTNLGKEVIGNFPVKQKIYQSFVSYSPKDRITDYLKESKATLAIVATRGKHGIEGLFSSSFAEHLIRFSPSDLYILRPRD